jgi:hypothetical protein
MFNFKQILDCLNVCLVAEKKEKGVESGRCSNITSTIYI